MTQAIALPQRSRGAISAMKGSVERHGTLDTDRTISAISSRGKACEIWSERAHTGREEKGRHVRHEEPPRAQRSASRPVTREPTSIPTSVAAPSSVTTADERCVYTASVFIVSETTPTTMTTMPAPAKAARRRYVGFALPAWSSP